MCAELEDAFDRAMQVEFKKKDLQPLALLRTYLDLTGESLNSGQLSQAQDMFIRRVVGFIYSEAEASLRPRAIYTLINSLRNIIKRVYCDSGLESPAFPHVSPTKCSVDTHLCIQEYRQIEGNPAKYAYYSGWHVKTKDGKSIFINLSAFQNVYGAEITKTIYNRISDYVIKRLSTTAISEITCLSGILNILVSKYDSLHLLRDIGSAENIDRLLEALFSIQLIIISSNKKNVKDFYVTVWPKQLIVIEKVFIDSGIWSRPYFPVFKPKFLSSSTNSNTHKNKSDLANPFNDKLVTPIPLSYSDDGAIKSLLKNVEADVGFIVSAFKHESKLIIDRFRKRKKFALNGEVKKIKPNNTVRSCIDYNVNMTLPENVCATWEYYNWNYPGSNIHQFLGYNTSGFIKNYSLLTGHLLTPFIYLLIKNHPEITSKWLASFRINDANGKKIGLVKSGDVWVATSYKRRKGTGLAMQSIYLNATSKELFDNIIELTADARAWLKEQGSNDCEYLFLSCMSGMSEPRRVSSFRSFRNLNVRNSPVGQALINWKGEQGSSGAESIINNLSLSSFRASCAVCVYLKTRSVKSMSEALGHTLYNPKLLSSYLPDPILRYFQSRWVRIFQNALVYEAMKDSEFIFDAMDISEGELELFLTNHKLKPLPIHLVDGEVSDLEHEGLGVDCKVSVDAIIPVSISLLRLINAITELVDSARSGQIFSGFLEKWYETAVFIQKSIENEQCSEVIIEAMRESRLNPLPQEIIKKAIYGN